MAVTITSGLPTEQDILTLAAGMRHGDIAELEAVCDLSPLQAIRESVHCADPEFLFAAHADGRLMAIGGATPIGVSGEQAAPWLLATSELTGYSKTLTRMARQGLALMLDKYALLANVIDARQLSTIRWLEALGFDMQEIPPIKSGFRLFRFEMRRQENCLVASYGVNCGGVQDV